MQGQRISSGSSFEEKASYSRAVIAGDMIFVSGTTGFNYEDMTIEESIVAQTEQCFLNISDVLIEAKSSLKDIVRILYIVPIASDFEKTWPILNKFLGEVRPAATMISANLLDPRMKIEIEVTAIRST